MRNNPLEQTPSSIQEFLVYKADHSLKERRESDKTVNRSFTCKEILNKKFSHVLFGSEFFDYAAQWLKPYDRFCVLAIQVDNFETDPGMTRRNHVESILHDVARTIDAVCGKENGIWGQFGRDLFGCFFPEQEGKTSLDIADEIKLDLSRVRKETLTIGTALFPTITYQKHEILENARKALEHASFFGPDSVVSFDAVSLNISGDNLYQEGDIDGAVDDYKKALSIDPNDINVHNSLGVCYGVMELYPDSLDEFETVINIDPDEFMAVYNIGLVYMLQGDMGKALEYFISADEKEKDVFEVVFQIGRVYLAMGKAEKAREHLEHAADLNPDSGVAFRYLGECHSMLGMTDEAVAAYKKAVKINPGDAVSMSAMGYLFEISGENTEISLTFCKQGVDLFPENGLFRHRLGRVYLKMERLDEALEEFKKAEALGHDSGEFIEKVEGMMGNK